MGKAAKTPGGRLFADRSKHLTRSALEHILRKFGPGALPMGMDANTGAGKPKLLGTGASGYVIRANSPRTIIKVTRDASEADFVVGAQYVCQGWWPSGLPRHYAAVEISCGVFAIWRDEVDRPGRAINPRELRGESQQVMGNMLLSYLHVAFQIWANSLRDPSILGELDFNSIPPHLLEEARRLASNPGSTPWPRIDGVDHNEVKRVAIEWAQTVNNRDGGVAGYEAMLALLFRIAAEIEETHDCRQLGHALAFFLRNNVLIQDLHFGNIAWSTENHCPVLFDVGRALLLGDMQDRVSVKQLRHATRTDWKQLRVVPT